MRTGGADRGRRKVGPEVRFWNAGEEGAQIVGEGKVFQRSKLVLVPPACDEELNARRRNFRQGGAHFSLAAVVAWREQPFQRVVADDESGGGEQLRLAAKRRGPG